MPPETVFRDPVCGMTVAPAKAAARREHGGREILFCATGCAEKFDRQPERYVDGRKSTLNAGIAGSSGTGFRVACVPEPQIDCGFKRTPICFAAQPGQLP